MEKSVKKAAKMTAKKTAKKPASRGIEGQNQATTRHGELLMSIVHAATADTSDRPTSKLNIRQRLVVQRLGLDGPSNLSSLGNNVGISPSSTTVVADRLEALGLVERTAKPGDRRAVILQLTDLGYEAFAAEARFYQSMVEQTMEALDSGAAEQLLAALAALDPATGQHDVA